LPPPGQRNAAAIPSIPTIATCSRKILDLFDGHGASLSVNFGPSSNSVSTTSLRPNNEIPISPRTKRTVPATMSQCGYARNKAKAFVIFASFCLKTTGGSVYGPLPARRDNPLKVPAFLSLRTRPCADADRPAHDSVQRPDSRTVLYGRRKEGACDGLRSRAWILACSHPRGTGLI
jgi:hypothetical protein